MNHPPKVGQRVHFAGSPAIGACEGIVREVCPDFDPDSLSQPSVHAGRLACERRSRSVAEPVALSRQSVRACDRGRQSV